MPLKQINTNLATKVVKNYRICKFSYCFSFCLLRRDNGGITEEYTIEHEKK